jgi:hypothetical protein
LHCTGNRKDTWKDGVAGASFLLEGMKHGGRRHEIGIGRPIEAAERCSLAF